MRGGGVLLLHVFLLLGSVLGLDQGDVVPLEIQVHNLEFPTEKDIRHEIYSMRGIYNHLRPNFGST